jgi:hypothetical protein
MIFFMETTALTCDYVIVDLGRPSSGRARTRCHDLGRIRQRAGLEDLV